MRLISDTREAIIHLLCRSSPRSGHGLYLSGHGLYLSGYGLYLSGLVSMAWPGLYGLAWSLWPCLVPVCCPSWPTAVRHGRLLFVMAVMADCCSSWPSWPSWPYSGSRDMPPDRKVRLLHVWEHAKLHLVLWRVYRVREEARRSATLNGKGTKGERSRH